MTSLVAIYRPTALEETFRKLLLRKVSVDEIKPIEVVFWKDRWWVLNGHRRLYLYKILERFDIIRSIWVVVRFLDDESTRRLFCDRFTTKTGGTSIAIRHHEHLERELETMITRELKIKAKPDVACGGYNSNCYFDNSSNFEPEEYLDYPFSEYDEKYDRF